VALFRRAIPRRALLAAVLGVLYAFLILPAPETTLGVSLLGVAWFILSLSLLFAVPLAYHIYTTWGLVWIVWRVVAYFREPVAPLFAVTDLILPVASVVLLMTSNYLEQAKAAREREGE
jgi:hypothetical protein